MRVDAARYFILFQYGGICADLDCECLRPLDPLLAGKQLLLVLEPYEHEKIHFPAGKPFEHIVCNALMVSMPGHPFWDHLFVQLMTYHRAPDPLNATGPFLLTRAYESFPHRESITIIPPEQFYPVSSITPWAELSPEAQTQVAQTAYAIHHWWGSWWRKNAKKQARQVKASLLVAGETFSRLAACARSTRSRVEARTLQAQTELIDRR